MLYPSNIRILEKISAKIKFSEDKIAALKKTNTVLKAENVVLEAENVALKAENIALNAEKQKNVGHQEENILIISLMKEVLLCEIEVKQKTTMWTMARDANHSEHIKLQRLLELYHASGVFTKKQYKQQHAHQNVICHNSGVKERHAYHFMQAVVNRLRRLKKELKDKLSINYNNYSLHGLYVQ
jgi:hypothetical protein